MIKNGAIFLWCLIHCGVGIAAEKPVEKPAEKLEIEVYHNRALDDDAIRKMSGLEQDPSLSMVEVKRRLETTSLFTNIDVRRNGQVVKIVVKEKTTWFIFPFYSNDSVNNIFGVAAGKSSAFNDNANILSRVQYGKNNREFSFLMKDNYVRDSLWSGAIGLEYENSLHRIFHGRDVFQTTSNQYQGLSLLGGYHFNPYTLAEFTTYVEYHHFEEPNRRMISGSQISHRIAIERGRFFSNEGLSRGQLFQGYFETTNPIGVFQFRKWGLGSQISLILHENFNWVTKPKIEGGAGLPRYQLFETGGGKLRGFPAQTFRGDIYAADQNDFFLTVARWGIFIIRPLVFVDWAFAQNSSRTGLGTGAQVYFREVAVPAIQIYAGYGLNPNGLNIAASIGTLL